MKRNYQKELESIIQKNLENKEVPSLLLHSCCAPCSTYVIEYLSEYFEVTVFYYNPNIYPDEEYELRKKEQEDFISSFPAKYPIRFLPGDFDSQLFYEAVKGMELLEEGKERCFTCYELRLRKAAEMADQLGISYFATTLTISPLKNAEKLNDIGESLSENTNAVYLVSDFKKKNGYQRSAVLSKEYGMYRQDYCGCVFSKQAREKQLLQQKESE